ncbi:hypothetical protein KIN20_028671, partial [Parelaphostrongylus tenuis]
FTLDVHLSEQTNSSNEQKTSVLEPFSNSDPDLVAKTTLVTSPNTVTIKIFPLPEVKRYGSLVFPDFAHGVAFFREVARQVTKNLPITRIH